jgi:hypothetical protein
MIQFFAKYPIFPYNLNHGNTSVLCRDIMQRVKMRDFLANNYLIFYPYTIKDHDTPEIIAAKLYDSPQYHWVVLIVNTIIDPNYDWPLSSANFIATLKKRYTTEGSDGLYYAMQTTHHFEDSNGNPIDETTFNALPFSERTSVTIYDWEVSVNEAKRQIRLLDKTFINQIDAEMNRLLANPVAR